MKTLSKWLLLAASLFVLSNCSGMSLGGDDAKAQKKEERPEYPMNPEDARKLRNGKLTGEKGLTFFDDGEGEDSNNSPIGVNSFLWRATLDTLTFLPITSADPFGGVILTDWYEDPEARGERFKVTALILDRNLRTDAIKVTVHKQRKSATGEWEDITVNADLPRKLEDTILTRARELRVQQNG